MPKQIRLNAFAMNCVAHQSPGLWTHPRDRTLEYNRLPYWIDLAKTLERGRFDGLFLADVLGVYDVYGNSPDAALRHATQTPANEPLMLIPAMAAVTKHLGFGVTSNLSFEPPYPFARRMSTLDHLTDGRVGWNVVTGYLDSAARGAGKDKQTAHVLCGQRARRAAHSCRAGCLSVHAGRTACGGDRDARPRHDGLCPRRKWLTRATD